MRRCIPSALGVVAALAIFEIGMRLALSPSLPEPPFLDEPPRATSDVEVRQYREGISTAHFSKDGIRLTGLPELAGAPVGVIMGDSHVAAMQVADEDTMGARLEARLRDEGRPVDVRQYGYDGAAFPTYVAVAPSLLEREQPDWVAVVVTRNDLTADALRTAYSFRARLEPDGSAEIVDVRPKDAPLESRRFGAVLGALKRAGVTPANLFATVRLARAVTLRFSEILAPPRPTSTEAAPKAAAAADARVVDATVRCLRDAYGPRLLVVYAPIVDASATAEPDAVEALLLERCAEEGVPCASARAAMLAERDRGRLTRGFPNTVPGTGHLNADGHRVVADVIHDLLSTTRAPDSRF